MDLVSPENIISSKEAFQVIVALESFARFIYEKQRLSQQQTKNQIKLYDFRCSTIILILTSKQNVLEKKDISF